VTDHGDSLPASSKLSSLQQKRPTTELDATVSWHDQLMATYRAVVVKSEVRNVCGCKWIYKPNLL